MNVQYSARAKTAPQIDLRFYVVERNGEILEAFARYHHLPQQQIAYFHLATQELGSTGGILPNQRFASYRYSVPPGFQLHPELNKWFNATPAIIKREVLKKPNVVMTPICAILDAELVSPYLR